MNPGSFYSTPPNREARESLRSGSNSPTSNNSSNSSPTGRHSIYSNPYAYVSTRRYLESYGYRRPSERSERSESDGAPSPGDPGYLQYAQGNAWNRFAGRGNSGPSAPDEVEPIPPIGGQVHPDWRTSPTVVGEGGWPTDDEGNPLPESALRPAIPYYVEDDVTIAIDDNWSSDRILRVQRQMQEGGLIGEFDYIPGRWDKPTRDAFAHILAESNIHATPWDQTLQEFRADPIPEPLPQREVWTPESFVRPNPENVGESVYNMVSQLVGPDYADDERVGRLTQIFLDESRNAWEQRQEIERQAFEYGQSQQLASQTGYTEEEISEQAADQYGVDDSAPPEEVEISDPEQSLQRETREELEGIMSAQENREQTAQAGQTLSGIFGSMNRWAGSGTRG